MLIVREVLLDDLRSAAELFEVVGQFSKCVGIHASRWCWVCCAFAATLATVPGGALCCPIVILSRRAMRFARGCGGWFWRWCSGWRCGWFCRWFWRRCGGWFGGWCGGWCWCWCSGFTARGSVFQLPIGTVYFLTVRGGANVTVFIIEVCEWSCFALAEPWGTCWKTKPASAAFSESLGTFFVSVKIECTRMSGLNRVTPSRAFLCIGVLEKCDGCRKE